jgi:hypothetical protein
MASYTVETNGDQALAAATAETLLSAVNAANATLQLIEWGVSFDGVSATAEPVTVELCLCTEAGAGTSTTHTLIQANGPTRTAQFTGKRGFSAEPTTITVVKRYLVHPQTGVAYQAPLGREFQQITTQDSLLIRLTAPAVVNAQGYIEIEDTAA